MIYTRRDTTIGRHRARKNTFLSALSNRARARARDNEKSRRSEATGVFVHICTCVYAYHTCLSRENGIAMTCAQEGVASSVSYARYYTRESADRRQFCNAVYIRKYVPIHIHAGIYRSRRLPDELISICCSSSTTEPRSRSCRV